jgi:hypothetical protein
MVRLLGVVVLDDECCQLRHGQRQLCRQRVAYATDVTGKPAAAPSSYHKVHGSAGTLLPQRTSAYVQLGNSFKAAGLSSSTDHVSQSGWSHAIMRMFFSLQMLKTTVAAQDGVCTTSLV